MTRVRLVDPSSDPRVEAILAPGVERYGKPLNTWLALAHHPAVLEQYFPFMFATFSSGPLDQETKLLVALRTAVVHGCDYTVAHRWTAAIAAGCDPDRAVEAACGATADLTPAVAAAIDFAGRVADGGCAGDGDGGRDGPLAELEPFFDDAERVELVFTVALWGALSQINTCLDLELDMEPAPDRVRRCAATRWTGER